MLPTLSHDGKKKIKSQGNSSSHAVPLYMNPPKYKLETPKEAKEKSLRYQKTETEKIPSSFPWYHNLDRVGKFSLSKDHDIYVLRVLSLPPKINATQDRNLAPTSSSSSCYNPPNTIAKGENKSNHASRKHAADEPCKQAEYRCLHWWEAHRGW